MLGSYAHAADADIVAPPSAYADMASQIASEDAAHITQVVSHPIDTAGSTIARAAQMEAQIVQETFAPFTEAPPSAAAVPGHYLSAILGVIGLVDQIQYVGIAALTAPIAAIAPPLPCATLTMPMLGIPHTHPHPPSTIPPAPPIPLPSFGMMTMPGAISVLVGGIPAARCGDVGLMLTCGTIGVPCEVMLGSSNTFVGGGRAARMGTDLFFHDNPGEMGPFAMAMAVAGAVAAYATAAGQAIDGNFAGAAVTMAQQAADGAAMALKMMRKVDPGMPPDAGMIMMGNATVLVGGTPFPAAMDISAILGKLDGIAKRTARRSNAASGDGVDPQRRNCGTQNCAGH
ncbi:MAG: PAAR domain-containing protein [Sandaracinaceae bacterium]